MGFPGGLDDKELPPVIWETWVQSLGWEDPQQRVRLPTPVFLGFPGGSYGKESPAMQGAWVQSLGREDALEEGMGTQSPFLPGESHGQRSLAGYVRSQRVGHN